MRQISFGTLKSFLTGQIMILGMVGVERTKRMVVIMEPGLFKGLLATTTEKFHRTDQ